MSVTLVQGNCEISLFDFVVTAGAKLSFWKLVLKSDAAEYWSELMEVVDS
jgi:hypothetical protein